MKLFLFVILTIFSLATHAQPCFPDSSIRVVVLGSSTAAGVGASVADSAWVNRYRAYLQSLNPNNEVVNLGVSATTTYHIMPDWFTPPIGRPAPNPNNNITKAIQLQADAIIVNMPSNDAFFGIGTTEQMNNFKTIAHEADSAGIPIWIGTTQPRNLLPAQIQIQLAVRDSILSYFGNHAIDFWTTIAGTDNLPNPLYDSGDGIHLNDAGHKILFERVVQKNIPTQIMDTCRAVGIYQPLQTIRVYPNPNDGNFIIRINHAAIDGLGISLHDLTGKEIFKTQSNSEIFPVSLQGYIESGAYFLLLKRNDHPVAQRMIFISH